MAAKGLENLPYFVIYFYQCTQFYRIVKFFFSIVQVLGLAMGLTAGLTLLIPVAAKVGGAEGAPIFLIVIR
jgi:hypothetical protein